MKKRAFVAEDDKKWQKIFRRNLEKAGFECDVVENYVKAKEMLPKNHYNVALLDIRLDEDDNSNQDGLLIASHIYKNDPDTAVLIVTGYGTVKITRDALKKYNAVDFYEKGEFDSNIFSSIANELLEVNKKRMKEINIDYISLMKNDYIERFQLEHNLYSILKPDGGDLNFILKKFIKAFFPLLRHKSHAGLHTRKNGFQGAFWSRSVGKPVIISLFSGKNITINPEEAKGTISFLMNADIEETMLEDSKVNVSVQISSVSGINFDDFDSAYNFS